MLPTPHPDDAAVRRRPGGRSAQVRRTVLDAALAELSAVGYAAFTIDGVARRSGVHKTTIYRRWNGPGQLVADAIISYADAAAPIPDKCRPIRGEHCSPRSSRMRSASQR
jgi:AcrR family transcriptional regulator